MTIQAARFVALQAQAAGLVDVAVRELGFALTAARQIYPLSANEITELTNEYANVLTQIKEHAEAAKVLEQRFDDEVAFPKVAQALMIAQLGRSYLNLNLEEDGRKLLAQLIDVLERQPQADRMIPAALIAYGELGERELADGNADQAAAYLLKAIDVLNTLNPNPSMRLVELHRGLASAYRQLQDFHAAENSLSTTLSILARLGGDHKDLNEAIRKDLRQVASQRPQIPDRFLDPPELLDKYFLLTPPGQSMQVTLGVCPVLADPANPNETVTTLAAGKKVWSLEFVDPLHRIYLPDEARFGWVHRQHLCDFEAVMIQSGRQKLEQALQDQPPEILQAVLDAFERARPTEGFSDPQQGISVIEESLATIRSHHKGSNSLVALLFKDLIALYQQTGNVDQVFRTTGTTLTQFNFGHGFQHPITATIRLQRAAADAELGDYGAEASELQECLKTCEVRFGSQDPRTQALHLRLAANQIRLGNVEQAEKTYTDLLATRALRDDQPSLLRSLVYLGLGELAASAREPDQATKYLSSAIEDFERLNHPAPPLSARALHMLGHCYGELAEPEKGIDRIVQAEQIRLGPEGHGLTLALMTKPDLTFLSDRTRGTKFHLDKARLCTAIGAEPDVIDDLLDVLDPLGDEFGNLFDEPERQLVIDAFRTALGEEAEIHRGSRASEVRYFTTPRPRGLHITAPTFAEPLRPIQQTAEFSSFEAQGLIPRDKTTFYHPLMQCGILLAGCGLGDATHPLNDGILTGEEIVAQDLRGTELVTLSVAPKIPFGLPFGGLPESEVLGMLPHAFQLAGARAVLSSDWKTNQPSTQRLMIAFYKQLAGGKAKAAALRAAQLEIRDQSGVERVPAAFWANFRLTGEGWRAAGDQDASPAK